MAIIRNDVRKIDSRLLRGGTNGQNQDEIPFIPAYDLLEAQENRLSAEEVAAIALALWKLLPSEETQLSSWGVAARFQGLR